MFSARQAEKSLSSLFEMSWIIPPRPNRASRPVIVKSVVVSTAVAPPSSRMTLTIVAFAPPWPRLSWPLAFIVTVRAPSSTDSICSSPR